MAKKIHGLALFSGGLDSLLASKLLQKQGLSILCVHFITPFFGAPHAIEKWQTDWDLEIRAEDISRPFVKMLVEGPSHGLGKTLNPCVDCKILMLATARRILEETGAEFIATGEVIGQRPMSQRRDSMDVIKRDAQVQGLLLRPLSAHLYPPTSFEESGLVDRAGLCGFSGRNRTQQFDLAAKLGLTSLPSPAGGCVLTELENGRRYWPILEKWRAQNEPGNWAECVRDFRLARLGRQFWREDSDAWLIIGRKAEDNAQLLALASPSDLTLKLRGFPGPLALCREGASWSMEQTLEAAEMLAAHSQRAMQAEGAVEVSVFGANRRSILKVFPNRHENRWSLPSWEKTREKNTRLAPHFQMNIKKLTPSFFYRGFHTSSIIRTKRIANLNQSDFQIFQI